VKFTFDLEKNKVVFAVTRIFFLVVFLVVSIGFLVWEFGGLLAWNQESAKNDLVSGLVVRLDGENVLVANAAEEESSQSEAVVVSEDARPLIIRRYLEKYKSPLAPYSDLIFELSETYGYDYRWIVAIAQQESNLCKKIPEDSHNCWGYGIHKNGTLKFDNYELALRSYAEYLKRVYFDKGLNTPETIMKKYCPSSNGSWAYGVSKFMDDMENGNF